MSHLSASCQLTLFTLLSLFHFPTIANDTFNEADLLSDIPLVASATRLPQKITDAPASITIIDREIIAASGAITIPDLFRLVPGMQAYSVTRNRYAATYHGMSGPFPNRLEVMINGRSIYLPMLFTVDWNSIGITLDDIDYIEIVRGSNVPAYGSNALLGAINIVTQSPVETQENSVSVMSGANNTEEVLFRVGDLSSSQLSFQLAGGYTHNDGSALYRDGLQNRHLNGTLTFTPNLYNTFDFHFSYADGYSEIGEGDKPDSQFVRREHQSSSQHLIWHHLIDEGNALKAAFYHNQHSMETPLLSAAEALALQEGVDLATAELFLALHPLFQPLQGTYIHQDNEHGDTDLYDLEVSQTLSLTPTSDLVWGLGYRFEEASSPTLLQNSGRLDEHHTRLFGNLQWKPTTDWTFNAGAMLEKSSLIDSIRLSPRIAANFQWDEGLTLRGAFTHAHRLPSLLERHGNFSIKTSTGTNWDIIATAPESLDSEELNSFELGALQRWPNANAQLDIRLFYEEIAGGIDSHYTPLPSGTDIDDFSRSLENVANWRNHGADIALQWHYRPDSLLMLNYGYLDVTGVRNRGHRAIGASDDLDSLNDRSPAHTFSGLMSYRFNNEWNLSVSHFLMSRTAWLEGASLSNPRKTFQRTDMALSRQFPLSLTSTLTLSLSVQNLFDRRYSEFYQYNAFDRRVYLKARLAF